MNGSCVFDRDVKLERLQFVRDELHKLVGNSELFSHALASLLFKALLPIM